MYRIASCLALGMLALITSCTTIPPGVVSVEARGGIFSEGVVEVIAFALGSAGSGQSSNGSSRTGRGGSAQYQGYEWSDVVHSSYGLQAAISTPVVDIIGGIDEHWFDDRGARETSVGLRKHISEKSDSGVGYIQILARRGHDIRTDSGLRDYDGIGIGFGGITPIDKHWFLDISIEFESTLKPLEIDGKDAYLGSLMLNVGVGWSP